MVSIVGAALGATTPFMDDTIEFLVAVSAAAGAIFALQFVAVPFSAQRWRGARLRTYATLFAAAELAAPLFFCLLSLIPPHRWQWSAGVVGAVGWLLIIGFTGMFYWERARRRVTPFQWLDWFQLFGTLGISGFVFGNFICQALAEVPAFGWVALLSVWLVMSGVTESWVLLIAQAPAQFEFVKFQSGMGPWPNVHHRVAICSKRPVRGIVPANEIYEMRVPSSLGEIASDTIVILRPPAQSIWLFENSREFVVVGVAKHFFQKPAWYMPYRYYSIIEK